MKHIIDDADKNKYEAYTKQETLAAIQEAISSGELPEEINGLVLTFKNPIDNKGYKIAFCTQAKYNELEQEEELEADCLYIITDDESFDDLAEALQNTMNAVSDLSDFVTALQTRIVNLENAPYVCESTEQSEYKTVTSNYIHTIKEGLEILVKFSYWGSTGVWNEMTLNVNNKGAKTITCCGVTITPDYSAVWSAGDLVKLRYEKKGSGYVWNLIENITQHVIFGSPRVYGAV